MNNKITRLIGLNKNDNKKLSGSNSSKVYVHLNHFFENHKKHFYLTFMSDIWNEGYFIPLNHVKTNGTVSSLNTFSLYHEKLGLNLEEIWKSEGISLFNFLNETLENKAPDSKEDFALKVTKFMYLFLAIPFEQTMKVLNWIYNSNYLHYTGKAILLTTFDLETLTDK